MPQSASVVLLVRCACVLVPAETLVGLKTRLWLPGDPATDQPESDPAASTDQSRSIPAGSESLNASPFASTPPPFVSVTLKPTGEPAITVAASARFSTRRFGFFRHEGNEKLPIRVRQLT